MSKKKPKPKPRPVPYIYLAKMDTGFEVVYKPLEEPQGTILYRVKRSQLQPGTVTVNWK